MSKLHRCLIAIVGGPGSGKTTVTNILVTTRRFTQFSVSESLRVVALGHGVDINNHEDLHRFADEFRARYGRGIFARFTLEIMETRAWTRAVVDGGRSLETLRHFSSFAERIECRFISIGVAISAATAFERVTSRARRRDPKAKELRAYLNKTEATILPALAACNYTIDNSGTIMSLRRYTKKLLAEILAEG